MSVALAKVKSAGILGIDGYEVTVEADVSGGMPSFDVVGLGDAAIKESKERVRSGIKNSGFQLKSYKITLNLAPASIKKDGTHYDLPLAVAVLGAVGNVNIQNAENYAVLGELSLYGEVRGVSGILPMADTLKKSGIKNIIVPYENRNEAAIIKGINIFPVKTLKETVDIINSPESHAPYTDNSEYICDDEIILDFSDVHGQEQAKRALEIACAGGHSCLMVGSPGSGKTMLSKRVPYILPPLTHEEAIEVTKLYSISSLISDDKPFVTKRPFRSIHHTASQVSLIGGGSKANPGEVSLAHNGVLFMDELPEFKRSALEVLRQPLEDKEVTVTRVSKSATYPCNFMVIAAMNPCPCGYMSSEKRECTCSLDEIRRYQKKISGPLLDRIDLQVEVSGVEYKEMVSSAKAESSEEIRKRVVEAREIQKNRYKNEKITTNSQLTTPLIKKYCHMSETAQKLLETAFDRLALSARGYTKIIKVARTIADLEKSENIEDTHIAEAIGYRDIDSKYFS